MAKHHFHLGIKSLDYRSPYWWVKNEGLRKVGRVVYGRAEAPFMGPPNIFSKKSCEISPRIKCKLLCFFHFKE